jgi:hypothetical protein
MCIHIIFHVPEKDNKKIESLGGLGSKRNCPPVCCLSFCPSVRMSFFFNSLYSYPPCLLPGPGSSYRFLKAKEIFPRRYSEYAIAVLPSVILLFGSSHSSVATVVCLSVRSSPFFGVANSSPLWIFLTGEVHHIYMYL